MDRINSATDWIGAYLEWTQCEWTETAASSQAHGGSVELAPSRAGKGATFRVLLPD